MQKVNAFCKVAYINAVALFEKNKTRKNYAVLKANLNNSQPKKIGLNTVNSIMFAALDTILFLQAGGSYTKVFLKDGKSIPTSKSLKYFEEVLAENPYFFRCHNRIMFRLLLHC